MTIHELRDQILALPALEKRMSNLRKEVFNASQEVSRLLRQYEQESRDVENPYFYIYASHQLYLRGISTIRPPIIKSAHHLMSAD